MRSWGITVLVGATTALLLSSCSASVGGSATQPPGGTAPSPASSTTATTTTPVPPGRAVGPRLTAACPVLTAGEVKQVLGGGQSTTEITATDRTVDDKSADKIFDCDYGAGGKAPFVLSLGNITEKGFSAAEAVKAFVDQAKATPQPIPNLGEAAAYFTMPDGDGKLAMAIRSYGELRTATFTAPAVVPATKLTELMALVAQRL